MKERRDYWPRAYDATEPALNAATWPCGHPRTPANSQKVGKGQGERCRICRRKIARESRRRRVEAFR